MATGFAYGDERFRHRFADFIKSRGFTDMYSAGFLPFPTFKEQWACWSRHIWYSRYVDAPKGTYEKLLRLLDGEDLFILTTNVNHRFQLAGFPKERLFYTQGDYGLWQRSVPCYDATYDSYGAVKRMVEEEHGMRVPERLVPHCPKCGAPMSMNLRADDTFVEDNGWHEAAGRYRDFMDAHGWGRVSHLELGVGMSTPVIIKYPFWQHTSTNPQAKYACANYGEAYTPAEIRSRLILLDADIDTALSEALALIGHEEAQHGVRS